MDQLSVLLQHHVSLLEERCIHLEKNICAVSNANAALEKVTGSFARPQATESGALSDALQRVHISAPSESGVKVEARTIKTRGRGSAASNVKGERSVEQRRSGARSNAERDAQPLVDAELCGIQHVPMISQSAVSPQLAGEPQATHRIQQLRAAIAQYFEGLKSAGQFWQVQESCDMFPMRSQVFRKQQQAIEAAAKLFCSNWCERREPCMAADAQCEASPATFCCGSTRNALLCAIEIACCVRKGAQELEEAYVAGADCLALDAAANALSELFAARKHLIDLGWRKGAADKLGQHSVDFAGERASEGRLCADNNVVDGIPDVGSQQRLEDDMHDRVTGRCAVLHQIGYAWQHMAESGSGDDAWPISSHALPGMSWVPDDVWRMIAYCEAEPECEAQPSASGAVGVIFQQDLDAKVWIAMLLELQRLAWELYVMESSAAPLAAAVVDMFQSPTPITQADNVQAQRYAALRALHGMFLPARGPTLSLGLKS